MMELTFLDDQGRRSRRGARPARGAGARDAEEGPAHRRHQRVPRAARLEHRRHDARSTRRSTARSTTRSPASSGRRASTCSSASSTSASRSSSARPPACSGRSTTRATTSASRAPTSSPPNLEYGAAEGRADQAQSARRSAGFGFAAYDVRQIKYEIQQGFKRMLLLVSTIAFAAMAVASLGVTNTIMASVRTRRWQFGILRSVGFTRDGLLRLVLAEAVLIGIVGMRARARRRLRDGGQREGALGDGDRVPTSDASPVGRWS